MKKIYENFSEIGKDFKHGEHWTHILSSHPSEECYGWQNGIMEFCEWLDKEGLKIVQNPEIYEKLWDDIRTGDLESYEKVPHPEKPKA